jgi:hypothetical protein
VKVPVEGVAMTRRVDAIVVRIAHAAANAARLDPAHLGERDANGAKLRREERPSSARAARVRITSTSRRAPSRSSVPCQIAAATTPRCVQRELGSTRQASLPPIT